MKNTPRYSYVAQKCAVFLTLILSFVLIGNVANASKRVALVIGNSAYINTAPLVNPRNDAEDLTKMLISLGFDVVSGFDLDSRGMRDKVRDFGDKLTDADVAMFFYAGHALQVNGRNYLAPVNTNIRHEGDLDFETIPMDFVQRQMERKTKTVLLFLDACRNNPLARNLRKSSRSTGATRGLARETNSSEGTFIAFATQPDNVALDGDGRNSPFTTALLANLDRPGVEISTLMTDVRRQVFEATDEQQIPWINSSLLGRFYFKGGEGDVEGKVVASLGDDKPSATDVSPTPAPEVKAAPVVKPRSNADTDQLLSMRLEQLAWEAVKDSNDVDELSAFINAYGTGFFGDLAKLRLAKIEKNNPKPVEVAKLEDDDVSRKIVVEKTIRDEPEATATPNVVTREITRQIQRELNRVGCVAGSADGLWGKKSVRATGLFAKHAKIRLVTLQPTYDLLDQLKTHNSRICPAPKVAPKPVKQQVKVCQQGQKLSRKGNCYWPKVKQAKTCQSGQRLSRKGNCYWPRTQPQAQPQRQPQPQVVRCQAGQQVTRNGQCYWPQQPRQQVIIQQPQPQPQPQRRNGGLLGGIVGGVIINCGILKNC